MARYRGLLRGDRGEVYTRLGDRVAGDFTAEHVGVRVVSGGRNGDAFYLYATGGRRAPHAPVYLGVVQLDEGTVYFHAAVQGGRRARRKRGRP